MGYILLIIVGLAIIMVSFFLSEKHLNQGENDKKNKSESESEDVKQLLEENKKQLQAESKKMVNETVNIELHRVEEQLAHISNEKIMAVNEFSEQLLEQIEENHKEVVFLYDMLNEKENEMKAFVQEIDKSKVVLEELANKELEKQKMLQHKRIKKELEKQMRQQEQSEKEEEDLKRSGVLLEEPKVADVEKNVPKVETQMSALERMGNKLEEVPKEEENSEPVKEIQVEEIKEVEEKQPEEVEQQNLSEQPEMTNQNQVILDLYNEGKSIMEIAKLLGKGQGEVKLVIDLFQGARK
jgi:hypothetical protein